MSSSSAVVFCDFDGTITASETFAGMIKEFAPELASELLPRIFAREITLKVGVTQMIESIPSYLYPEMIAYAQDKPIRPGFAQLLDFLSQRNIPLVVVSGGLRDMVKMVLQREGVLPQVAGIAAMDLDTTGEYLRVNSAYLGDTELVAKVQVMREYPTDKAIAIGDSVTDINLALAADLVFARDRLPQYLDAAGKTYLPWEDFRDVMDYLQQIF